MRWRNIILTAAGFAILAWIAGCHTEHVAKPAHDDVAMPAPLGSYVNKFDEMQNGKAKASTWVLFLDEWYMGGTLLGLHGSRHLDRLMVMMAESAAIIQIQPSLDPDLNEKRRLVIVNALLKQGIAAADLRVVLAFPQAEDLNGDEAERMYHRMINPPRNNFGAGGFGQGNFGQGGFGQGNFGQGGFGNQGIGAGGYLP